MTALSIDGPIIANWVTKQPDGTGLVAHEITDGSAVMVDGGSLGGIQLLVEGSQLEPDYHQFGALWIWSTSQTTLLHQSQTVATGHRFACTQAQNFVLGTNPILIHWYYNSGSAVWEWRVGDATTHQDHRGMFLPSLVSGRSSNFIYRGPAASVAQIDYVLSGSLTLGATATLTPKINDVAITNGAVSIPEAQSGDGADFSTTPTGNNDLVDGDRVSVQVTGTNVLDTTTAGVTLTLAM